MKMNSIKTLAATLVVGAAATVASATTTIHIVGSTAFRASVMAATVNILTSPTAAWTGNSSFLKCTQAVVAGNLTTGGQAVVFEFDWSGSVGGVQTLAQQSPVITKPFPLPDSTNALSAISLTGSVGGYGFTGGHFISAGFAPGDLETVAADVSLSDSFQGSTIFSGSGFSNLTDQVVGVVPFVFVRGNATNAPAGFTAISNITTQQAINLLNGGLPLSQFDGNIADDAVAVEVLGRDEDSGTRLDTFAETGFGIQSTPLQYNVTSTSNVITSVVEFPANTVNGISYPAGHSGFSSGGTLATNLGTPVNSSLGQYFIGYVGTSDASTAVGLGGSILTYNGVAESTSNIVQGLYTFWSYEHVLYGSSFSGTAKTAADQLATQILNTDAAQAGVLVGPMQVGRAVEGGPVTFGNPY